MMLRLVPLPPLLARAFNTAQLNVLVIAPTMSLCRLSRYFEQSFVEKSFVDFYFTTSLYLPHHFTYHITLPTTSLYLPHHFNCHITLPATSYSVLLDLKSPAAHHQAQFAGEFSANTSSKSIQIFTFFHVYKSIFSPSNSLMTKHVDFKSSSLSSTNSHQQTNKHQPGGRMNTCEHFIGRRTRALESSSPKQTSKHQLGGEMNTCVCTALAEANTSHEEKYTGLQNSKQTKHLHGETHSTSAGMVCDWQARKHKGIRGNDGIGAMKKATITVEIQNSRSSRRKLSSCSCQSKGLSNLNSSLHM